MGCPGVAGRGFPWSKITVRYDSLVSASGRSRRSVREVERIHFVTSCEEQRKSVPRGCWSLVWCIPGGLGGGKLRGLSWSRFSTCRWESCAGNTGDRGCARQPGFSGDGNVTETGAWAILSPHQLKLAAGSTCIRLAGCCGCGASLMRSASRLNAKTERLSHIDVTMKVKITSWNSIATWRWDVPEEDVCGICQIHYDGTCPSCKYPGDDCSVC